MTLTETRSNAPNETQSIIAWTAIAAFFSLTGLLLLAKESNLLNLFFPAAAGIVAGLLYFRHSILFNGFSWWIWFSVAFVRRVSDWQGSFTEPSPILLAPYLAMGFTVVTLWKYAPRTHRQQGGAFVAAAGAVFFGICVAIVNGTSPANAVIVLLDWLIPVSYGFHLFVHWRDYPSYRQNLQSCFAWGIFLMGLYGLYQYLVAPAWDTSWLTKSGMITANGYHDAEALGPMAIRVFSTMHSVEPFAVVAIAALLMLLSFNHPLRLPALILGHLALLLTMMRSAWIGWLVGILSLFGSLTAKSQLRFIATCVVLLLLGLPVITMEQFSGNIVDRLQTLANVQADSSVAGRTEYFGRIIDTALMALIGDGLSRNSADNSLLVMLLQMGWVGTLPYFGGMLLLSYQMLSSPEGRTDPFVGAARAIVISSFSRILANNLNFGVPSVVLWGFLGIGLASAKYYHYQRIYEEYNLDFTDD
jgi:hypothetical protein